MLLLGVFGITCGGDCVVRVLRPLFVAGGFFAAVVDVLEAG
jgi:hypothetical protein